MRAKSGNLRLFDDVARVVPNSPARYNARLAQIFSQPRGEIALNVGLRIGIGHDTHRLSPGGTLRLGGVDIPNDRAAVGHSDADVLLHAITDALLGAAALGDIGELFPDADPLNKNRDSADFVTAARERIEAAGYEIVNLDCVVFLQRPKLLPYREPMRTRIAHLLRIAPEQIGLKAKTGEGVDAVGREEAISSQCVALLQLKADPKTSPSPSGRGLG